MYNQARTLAVRVALCYALGASLWIAATDLWVGLASGTRREYTAVNMLKGIGFVLTTSLLLFLVLRKLLQTESQARVRAEETARQLNELKAIAEHSGELLYKHDLQHRFTYLSPQFHTLLGYGPEDQQMDWQQLLTDNSINARVQEWTNRAIRSGERQAPYLVEVRKKDGATLLMEVDESPLKDKTGKVVAIVGAARDVTERERAQCALRQSEEKFRQLAETITEVFWMADLALDHVTYVSPAYQQVWGRSPESLYQNPQGWFQAAHPEDQERVRTTFGQNRGAQEISAEYRIVRPDGSVRWVLDRAFPLRNESGQPIGLVGLAKDITESKLAEASLRESEQLYRAIFEAANDGILILEEGRFIDCNQRAQEIYGATRAELIGKTVLDFAPERQPDGELSAAKTARLLTRVAAGEPQCFHCQHVRPNGTRFTAEVSLRRFTLGPKRLALAITRDITGRLQAEEALRESESKLRGLYTSMTDGLALHEIIYDASGAAVDYRILDINPAYEVITGLPREQVLGKPATAAYRTSEAPFLAVYAQVAASGEPTAFEIFFAPIQKHFAVSVFSPGQGQFATVFSDINKRKESERQICLLNQVYALISHINEAIVRIADQDTLFREACRITVEEGQFPMAWVGLLDETTQRITPAAWAGREEGYLAQVRTMADTSPEGMGPTGFATREGRVVICGDIAQDPRMAPWREAALARGYRSLIALPLQVGGRAIGVFVVYSGETDFFSAFVTESLIEVAADISFALELFERNRQRELEQQQLRLQHSALEAAANAIVITRRDGTIEWVNAAFTRLTGYRSDEAIGRKPSLLRSGAHSQEFYQMLWSTVLAGSVWQGALTNKRKDGSLYDEETTITPVLSAAGEVTHFVAIKQDITERKRLEQQFLRAQRMQSIGLLAGGVAHDLNNVLAPVLMALPLLRNPLSPDQRDQILETLEHSVKRGANIVQQVLTFARGVEVQRTVLQLRHLIKEVARIAEETFPRDIRIRSSVPADLWPLEADPTQIHQVLLNLAVNGRDAMPEGGQLSFTAQNLALQEPRHFLDCAIRPGRYVTVSVADTGSGIPLEVLERMFEPFFTTKPVGKGTGLGLSTVLGIVKSHGGLVEVQTRVGTGSIFRVYLPAALAEAALADAAQKPALPQGQGELILVVDDEVSILQVTQSTLETNGYRVVTAKDGRQAVARFVEHGGAIQTVLTDLMMPVMDGLALARTLRKLNPELPIIAATGLMYAQGEEDRAERLRELGVQQFLHKPFLPEELLKTLKQALRG